MYSEPDAVQLIACLAYRDARAAIAWLKGAFGFAEHLVVPGDGDTIEHAQLTLGPTMIMLGSEKEGGIGMRSPKSLRGITQSVYLIVRDDDMVDAIHERATSAGAETVVAPADQDYGGRLCALKDPEGNIWSFGSYNPWVG